MKQETHRRQSARPQARRTRAQRAQHRRFVLVVLLLALMVVITAVSSHSCREEGVAERPHAGSTTTSTLPPLASATYTAQLTGESQPGATTPVAVLSLHFDAAAGTLMYKLEVITPLADPGIAAICQGVPGANGATLFTLFPGPTVAGDFSGVLAEGTISALDLVGPLQGATLEDLVRLVEDGGVYATIGTRQFPIDAVRGQIG